MIKCGSLAGAFLFVVMVAPASAQNTEDSSAFDFSLPGARSRGIGGAFVAIADDATSVYSNPAGLTLLFRPEVSIEGRRWNLHSPVIDSGHAYGPATNIGVDTVNGLVKRTFSSDAGGVSFLSFVYPRNRWAIGIFRHQLARYQMDREYQGAFFDCRGGFRGDSPMPPYCGPESRQDGVDRIFPARQSFDLDIHSTGASFAVDWTESFSAGLTLQYFGFEISGSNRVFSARGDKKYGTADFTDPANLELVGTQSGKDNAWGINAGVLWDVAEHWAAGASFRQGPKFHFLAQTTTGPANPGPAGVTFVNIPDNPFKVPDTFAAGLAFRPSNAWRVGFEYDLVKFGQLIADLKNTSTPANDPEGALLAERLHQDTAHQFRVGSEYAIVVPGGKLLALRGGVWYDPPHQPFFEVDSESTGLPAPRWPLYFPQRTGSIHGSAGFGFATARHFQLDAAVDLSKPVDTFALSSIWRF